MKKDLVLHSVKHSISSIFTKDDVLKLIESIEQEQSNQVYDLIKKLQDLQENISYRFQNLTSDEVVDYDSVEFSIGYNNRIEVEDVSLNVDNLTDIVIDSFSCLIDELRELELGSDDINVVEEEEEVVLDIVQENEL